MVIESASPHGKPIATRYVPSLADGEQLVSDYFNTDGISLYRLQIKADQANFNVYIESYDDKSQPTLITNRTNTNNSTLYLATLPTRQRFIRAGVRNETGAPVVDDIEGAIALPPGTDVKGTVEFVSDNNTVAQINMEYYLIDRV